MEAVVFVRHLQLIGLLTGLRVRDALLNTAAAIVIYLVYSFVLPGLFELGANLIGWFADLRPWIDFNGGAGAARRREAMTN